MDAFDDQSLAMGRVGAQLTLTAVLTNENAAAVMTVLTQKVDAMRRDGDLALGEQPPGGTDPGTSDGRRMASMRHSHLLAIAFADTSAYPLAGLLLEAWREVLYVGRAERVVPPRLRRALEVRDQHCRFPGCRAHVRRCHAHHVREWENGGSTDVDNCVLLCVRHHHAVHESGWTLSRAAGIPPGATGCWEFTPPGRQRRPW
jgi:hypothetical protein